jgi:hypothetical protein
VTFQNSSSTLKQTLVEHIGVQALRELHPVIEAALASENFEAHRFECFDRML